MSDTGTERRADHEVRQAVDNIQIRFLERVGDRVARALSLRELGEELIIESLRLIDASYGCVLRLEPSQASTGLLLKLDAVVSLETGGSASRQHDTLLHRQPDSLLMDVISSGKAIFSNNAASLLTSNLPSCHPRVRSFALLPIREKDEVRALLFVANAELRFDLVLLDRLQSMLDAFMRVHINSIVNRGINNVIADIGQTSRQLVTVLNASFNGVMTIDEHIKITAFNPACERMFGVDIHQALGSSVDNFLPQDVLDSLRHRAASYNNSLQSQDTPATVVNNVMAMKADGRRFAVELASFHTRIKDQVFSTLIFNDISDRIQSARELQDASVQYKTLAQLAPVGIVKLNQEWTCDYANDMWCQLTGHSLEQNMHSGWIDTLYENERAQTLMNMRRALLDGNTYRQVVRLNPPDGRSLWVSMSATGLINSLKNLTGSLVVIMDITEQYLAEKRLTQIAHHDALTGLPNRNSFLNQLHLALDKRKPHGIIALLFIDLDGFKAINDTLGHDAGDELLQQVARRIRHTVREEDVVARLGGDEFTVTLRTLENSQDASIVADAIVHGLKQPFLLQMEEVYVSASVGIALATGMGHNGSQDANSLIKQADVALYRAKLSGRSRHIFFTPELDQAQRDRSVLITSLRRAVDRQDFELFYQPQLLIKEQRLLGFEALLRWPQDTGEHVSPGAFIDVLEETGLIGELGEWAIGQACGQHRIWLRKGLIGPATTMSVNVSARQLGTPHFAQRVAATLDKHSMRPDSLILEITESALVQTIETNIINDIKDLGVQISLDDFGTGYSSLAYLSQLPLDHLKIDRSFIADIKRFPHAVTVIKSIIALARTLGIRVIAEGVEDGDILPMLAKEGCEGYQGYYFSKPLPAREMANTLKNLETVRLSHYANFIDLDSTVAQR
ncbi:EAL domain-containing protein [Granulosicoccus antarcticus]|uniref:EAL domain-containing protein n=1 Tax=Granulosicoccus antarcticus TaxID=437505 RepID=UPI0012FD9D93|nr:EAL domain-containing protein [Granulosicoccus antarcticus]